MQFFPKRQDKNLFRLDIFYIKPIFNFTQSLTPFECKLNFNQFVWSCISHIVQKFHRKIFIAVCVGKIYFTCGISTHIHGAPALNQTLFALSYNKEKAQLE